MGVTALGLDPRDRGTHGSVSGEEPQQWHPPPLREKWGGGRFRPKELFSPLLWGQATEHKSVTWSSGDSQRQCRLHGMLAGG